jgi:anti-sigma B factor antagonist
MSTPPVPPAQGQWFQIERHGDVAVIIPSPEIEKLPENQVEVAAQLVLAPLKENPPNGLIVDLSGVNFFGSVFISFLLRCHLLVKKQGNELVLAGVSDRIRELLRLTSLDTLWALYATRAEALAMLEGSD